MTEERVERASLTDLAKLREKGELHRNPNAPEGDPLDAEFWKDAKVEKPEAKSDDGAE